MGTNFYLQRRNPDTGRCSDMHIGKTSYGWVPNLVGYKKDVNIWSHDDIPEIISWQDWKVFLLLELGKGGLIFDEYDEPLSYEEFIRRIETHLVHKLPNQLDRPLKNHAVSMLREEFRLAYSEDEKIENRKKYWIDDQGFSFSAVEFS